METINYQGLIISKHCISFANDFWDLDYQNLTKGVIFSQLVLNAETENKINNGKDINVTLILRNQSDFSNVVILVGIFNIQSQFDTFQERSTFVEFLFEEVEKYVEEISLKGKDGKPFLIPENRY